MADKPDKPEQHYQPEQSGMYELEFPAPQLSSADGSGPVLIHALEGFSDAGHAIRLAAQYLKNTLDTELVASFAIDELLDYRSRRPLMTFKTDHFTSYEEPELNLYALHDSVGTPFLLLAGMEPDLRWERFITAVRLLAERLGVSQDDMQEARQADLVFSTYSLDAPMSDRDDPALLADMLGEDDPDVAHTIDMEAVNKHWEELPEREQRILGRDDPGCPGHHGDAGEPVGPSESRHEKRDHVVDRERDEQQGNADEEHGLASVHAAVERRMSASRIAAGRM